jgi:hypothetical protein
MKVRKNDLYIGLKIYRNRRKLEKIGENWKKKVIVLKN